MKTRVSLVNESFDIKCKNCGNKSEVHLSRTSGLKIPVLIVECKNQRCNNTFDSLINGFFE